MSNDYQFDVLIIGSGAAGLMSAIQLSDNLSIAVIAKDKILEGSSYYAQGGISAVLDPDDNFERRIQADEEQFRNFLDFDCRITNHNF